MGNNHRTYIGPMCNWGAVAGHTFKLLFDHGMKPKHKVLDIGCGALRVGRVLIPYLNAGGYYGQEPNFFLVEESIKQEVGNDVIDLKKPVIKKMEKFYDFSFGEEDLKFDFIFAHSIWTHASPTLIKNCSSAAARVMTDNTIFFSTYRDIDLTRKKNISETTSFKEDWLYPGCYAYRRETIQKIVESAGLELVEVLSSFEDDVIDLPQPKRQIWGVFRLKR